MNSVLIQYQKDVFRLRKLFIFCLLPILVKLIGLMLLAVISGALTLIITHHLAEIKPENIMMVTALGVGFFGLGAVFAIISFVLPYLLIPMMIPILIHEDPLVGTTAFWLTRPVAAKQLFTAKMLVIATMILLVVVDHLIPLNQQEVSFDVVMSKLTSFLPSWVVAAVCITLISCLTENFRGFLLYCFQALFIYLGMTLLIMIAQKVCPQLAPGHLIPGSGESGSNVATGIRNLIIVAGGLGLVYHQFITRRTFLTVRYATLGLFLIVLLSALF